jgi:hypothetical protein
MHRLALLLLVAACSGPGTQPDARPGPSGPGPRVLFVGNSLTGVNDVPGMVASIGAGLDAPLAVDAVVLPGSSLGDHLAEGSARRRLEADRWDFVVLQQGPSSRPESRRQLREDVARFAPLIRAAGARPALYMVWAVASEPEWFDEVHDSYEIAARDIDGLFLPGGEAWRAAWRIDPSLALYSPDGLHPTVAGSYAAALVIAGGLTGRSPIGAPTLDVDPDVARILQRGAAEVLAPPEPTADAGPDQSRSP